MDTKNSTETSSEKAGSGASTLTAVVIVGLLIAGAYAFTSNNSSSEATNWVGTYKPTETPPQTETSIAAPIAPVAKDSAEQTASLAEQKQCATDGATFYQNWVKENVPVGSTIESPEYHFNQKLNTCIAYVGDAYPLRDIPFYGVLNGQTVPAYISMPADHNDFVYEVYSNEPIIQSETTKTCTTAMFPGATNVIVYPTVPAGQCNDVLDNYLVVTSVPNLGADDFFTREKILMSQ